MRFRLLVVFSPQLGLSEALIQPARDLHAVVAQEEASMTALSAALSAALTKDGVKNDLLSAIISVEALSFTCKELTEVPVGMSSVHGLGAAKNINLVMFCRPRRCFWS